MTYTVEVNGKSADRFRAYTAAKITRKPSVADHVKRAMEGKPALASGSKIRYDAEQIAIEGDVSGDSVSISADDTTITRVVFYRGPREQEAVVGSVEVNASGDIEIEMVEPAAAGEPVEAVKPEVIDE